MMILMINKSMKRKGGGLVQQLMVKKCKYLNAFKPFSRGLLKNKH